MNNLFGMDYVAVGERVRALRQAQNLRQAELAKRVGVSNSFVGHIERAEKIPSMETLARLSQALDTTLDYLVFGIRQHCERESCPLYGDMQSLLEAYGLDRRA